MILPYLMILLSTTVLNDKLLLKSNDPNTLVIYCFYFLNINIIDGQGLSNEVPCEEVGHFTSCTCQQMVL